MFCQDVFVFEVEHGPHLGLVTYYFCIAVVIFVPFAVHKYSAGCASIDKGRYASLQPITYDHLLFRSPHGKVLGVCITSACGSGDFVACRMLDILSCA